MADKGIIVFKLAEFPHISETFILNQIRTAIDLGYNVKILTNVLLDHKKRSKSKILEDYNLLEKVILEDYKIPKNRIKRVFKWFKLLIVNFRNIFKIIAFHFFKKKFSLTWLFVFDFYWNMDDVKLLHVQYGTNKSSLPELKAAGFKPRLICQFHGHDAFFPINGWIENNGYYDLMFETFDYIITNTQFLTDQLKKLGCSESKICQIPVSVDTNFFINKKRKSKIRFKLVSIGRLSLIKGHKQMIEIMDFLTRKNRNFHLTIIGGGDQELNLIKQIKQRGLSRFISLKGSLSSDEILEILQDSDVFIFTPIAQKSGWGETQGLSLSEAMSCAVPVISYDVGGVKYTFEHGISGFLVSEMDTTAMVEKIELLEKFRNLRNEMGVSARLYTENNFSKEVIDKKWNLVYSQLSE